jgi:hypothetical protein
MKMKVRKFIITSIVIHILLFSIFMNLLSVTGLESDDYPWFEQGTDTIIKLLWNATEEKFMEMPQNVTAYWVDDQAKLLWLMLENPLKYGDYISKSIDNLYSVWHEGYFPRRWVILSPRIVNGNVSNCEIENGFLKIMGDMTGEDPTNPLRVRYYEAAGGNDLFYLGGQLFTVIRLDKNYYWITYDPLHLRAEQSQNPGFDIWNGAWSNDTMMLPWMFNYPEDWIYSDVPPMGCSYSARWVFEEPQTGRCIGLENYTVASKNWRSSEFVVSENTSYSLSFKYRGDFVSGGSFKVFLRWFNGTSFISQNYAEFSTSYGSWQSFSNDYVSPVGANCSDILFWSEADTNGNYYIDDVSVSDCTVLNGNFEVSHGIPVDDAVYHSRSKEIGRSLKLYDNYEYAMEWLPISVPVSNFYNISYWCETAIPTVNINVSVLYSDGTYSTLSKPCNSSSWVVRYVQQSELTAGKTIVAFGFATGTIGVDTWVDDVGFSYQPSNANTSYSVDSQVYPNATIGYVQTVQSYADDDVNLTVNFRLSNNNSYVEQPMSFKNKKSYPVQILFTSALDGLSTVTSGEGTQETAYSSVWIPEVGRRSHERGSYSTTLLYPEESYKWSEEHNYFIVELKQIPEWSGCYGIAVKVPVSHFNVLQNSNPNGSSPYLHYLTYGFRYDVLPLGTQTFSPKIVCLNGYDFVNPTIYDYYLMNLEQFPNVDLSMSFHIGTITHALARYLQVKGSDPYDMGLKTWDYYRSVFNGHNNGSYLLTTGKMMEASMIYYNKTQDSKYLDFAEKLGDYLVSLQVTDPLDKRYGTFPMKHNAATYLDTHAGCLIGLKLIREYNASYNDAYNLGLSKIYFDYVPSGFKKLFDPADSGMTVPNIKRLFVYSNSTHIDDDFFTFKSGHVALAAQGVNDTLTMLALSRVWRNVDWNGASLIVYVSESIPARLCVGTRSDWVSTNSETQPYGLIPWLEVAKYQRTNYQWQYQFLARHYAITRASLQNVSCDVDIHATNGTGTTSSFYLKGITGYAVPVSIQADGLNITNTFNDLISLSATSDNGYYYNETEHQLAVKAFVSGNETVHLAIAFEMKGLEIGPWPPLAFILGIIGLFCCVLGPIYAIDRIRHHEYFNALKWGAIVTCIGIVFVIGWLWSLH